MQKNSSNICCNLIFAIFLSSCFPYNKLVLVWENHESAMWVMAKVEIGYTANILSIKNTTAHGIMISTAMQAFTVFLQIVSFLE